MLPRTFPSFWELIFNCSALIANRPHTNNGRPRSASKHYLHYAPHCFLVPLSTKSHSIPCNRMRFSPLFLARLASLISATHLSLNGGSVKHLTCGLDCLTGLECSQLAIVSFNSQRVLRLCPPSQADSIGLFPNMRGVSLRLG